MVTAAQPNIEFHESTRLPVANVRQAGDFPHEDFETISNVAVFREHETVTRSGRQIKFGKNELQAVADRCNQRIAETGDFAAITVGHTPSPEERAAGSPEPPVIGFAGPFRLGRLGHGNSISYAILADFHVRRDCHREIAANPRRSPELWLEDRYEDMFLDPIALLAGQAPRLDLGLLYSANRNGQELLKYAGPAMPGPMSTFIPSQDYAADSQPDTETHKMALTPDEVGQIVDAIEQLDWVTEVKSMLSSQLGAADGGVGAEAPEPAIPPAEGAPADMPGDAPADPAIEPAPEAGIGEPAADPMPEAGPPAAGGADPPAEPPVSPPEEEPIPMAADSEGNVGRQGKLDALFAEMDQVDDESFAKYCANRQSGKQQYAAGGADAGEDDAAATYDQTANEAPDIAGSTNAIDIGGGKKMYEAQGSVQGPKPEQPTQGTAEGSGTGPMGEGSVDDASGNAASSYQAQAKYSRAIHQIDQLQAKVSEQGKMLQYERGARVDAERLGLLTQLHNQGYTIDPDEVLERCKYGKMSDDAFGDEIAFIAKSVQRVPFGDLPTASHSALQDGHAIPGVQADRQKYSRNLSDRALRICEAKALAGEAPDYQVELEKLQDQRA